MYSIFCVNRPRTDSIILESQRLFTEIQSNLNEKQSINDYFNSFFGRTETYFKLLEDIKNNLSIEVNTFDRAIKKVKILSHKLRQTSCLTGLNELIEDQGCLLMVDTYESNKRKCILNRNNPNSLFIFEKCLIFTQYDKEIENSPNNFKYSIKVNLKLNS